MHLLSAINNFLLYLHVKEGGDMNISMLDVVKLPKMIGKIVAGMVLVLMGNSH